MAVVEKPNGDLQICVDPQPLNAALQREHYKLPTVDNVLPKLNGAKIFTKLITKKINIKALICWKKQALIFSK